MMTEKQRQELCERFSQIFAVANPDPNVPFEKFIYDALLKAFIAGAEYAWNNPNWISVEDELPKADGRYIIADKYDGVEQMNFDAESKYWWLRGTGEMSDFVTHWIPMPQLPRKKK